MTTRLEQATDCTDPQDLDAILRDEHEEDSPGERAVLRRACRHLAHDEERYPVSVLDPAHAVTTGLQRVGGLAGLGPAASSLSELDG